MLNKVNPAVDCVFKEIFGTEEAKPRLIDLLNSIFEKTNFLKIKSVTLQNPYSGKKQLDEKEVILDIWAVDETERKIQVEIQVKRYAGIEKRIIFSNAKLVSADIKAGKKLPNIPSSISIWIFENNLNSIPNSLKTYYFRDQNGNILSDATAIITLEIPKFLPKIDDKLSNWMYLFKEWDHLELNKIPKKFDRPIFKEAFEVIKHFNDDNEKFHYYRMHEEWLIDQALRKEADYNEGVRQGIEQGVAQGLEQGIEQGIEQGQKTGALANAQQNLIKLISSKFQMNSNIEKQIMHVTDITKIQMAFNLSIQDSELNAILEVLSN